jgi:preprotein translocase subunit YajC
MQSLGGLLFPLLILLLFIPIFLSGRKQRRQMATMQQLQSSLEVGDVVTTTSGLRGTVVDVSYEETVDLEIADDVVTTWMRAAVRDKVADSTPDTASGAALGSSDAADLAPEAIGTGTAPAVDADLDRPVGRTQTARTESAHPDAVHTDGAHTDGAHTDTARPDVARTDRVAGPADAPSDANGTPRP